MTRQKRHIRTSIRGRKFIAGHGISNLTVIVRRRDNDTQFTIGKFVALTKNKIFIRDPEFDHIKSFDRSVFYVEKPFGGFG